jgi:hypothetical protein
MLSDYTIRFSDYAFIIEVPNLVSARKLVYQHCYSLALTALKFSKEMVEIRCSGCNSFQIPAYLGLDHIYRKDFMNSTDFPGLYLGQEIKIYSADFLRALLNLFEKKDTNSGLVRLRDNAQLVLTHGSALNLGLEVVDSYTRLRRDDYWQPQDLQDFNREWMQILREDGSNYIEYSYLALLDPINDQDERLEWGRFTSRYRLLKDGTQLYHQCEALDYAPAPRPVVVRAGI